MRMHFGLPLVDKSGHGLSPSARRRANSHMPSVGSGSVSVGMRESVDLARVMRRDCQPIGGSRQSGGRF